MAYQVPTGVPATFPSGTTVTFKIAEHPDYPVSESWVYTFYLVGYLGASATGTGASGEYTFTVAASATANVLAGPYRWEIRASLAGAVYPVSSGRVEVTANSAVLTGADARTWTEKMIAAIETLLYGSGTIPEVESYQIHGRALTKMDRAELMKWLTQLRGELASQVGGGKRASVRMYFGNAR